MHVDEVEVAIANGLEVAYVHVGGGQLVHGAAVDQARGVLSSRHDGGLSG